MAIVQWFKKIFYQIKVGLRLRRVVRRAWCNKVIDLSDEGEIIYLVPKWIKSGNKIDNYIDNNSYKEWMYY